MPISTPRYLPRLVQRAAVVALAAGVGVWGAILFAPSPPPAPPTAAASTTLATDTQPVSRWFGTGSGAKIQVVVAGLISAGPRGSAVLAIDGRPARAYAVGNDLAEGVTLAEVGRSGVVLNQGGERVEVRAATLPPLGETIRTVPLTR
jgi:general secretion pathway protein C